MGGASADVQKRPLLARDLGFPIHARGDNGATPLHAAAGSGSVEMAQLLLDRGADLDARDTTWGGPPIVWATVGSGLRYPAPDWVATVQTLIDSGASPKAWVDETPTTTKSRNSYAPMESPSHTTPENSTPA